MRKLLLLAGAIALAWWLFGRGSQPAERATVGYEDGSSVELDPAAAGYERLFRAAREALGT